MMKNALSVLTILVIATFVTSLASLLVLLFPHFRRISHGKKPASSEPQGTCSGSCSAIDPVNDPDYNMRNVVKQSILLEEHLAETNKYCEPCIVKHFQHIIGLAEEATWLAGSKVEQYPYLSDSASFYDSLFEKWRAARKDTEVVQEVLERLRERRRALIEAYFLG